MLRVREPRTEKAIVRIFKFAVDYDFLPYNPLLLLCKPRMSGKRPCHAMESWELSYYRKTCERLLAGKNDNDTLLNLLFISHSGKNAEQFRLNDYDRVRHRIMKNKTVTFQVTESAALILDRQHIKYGGRGAVFRNITDLDNYHHYVCLEAGLGSDYNLHDLAFSVPKYRW